MTVKFQTETTYSLSCLENPDISAEQFQERARQLLLRDPFLIYDILRILSERRQLSASDSGRRVMRRLYTVRNALTGSQDLGQRIDIVHQAFAPRLRLQH